MRDDQLIFMISLPRSGSTMLQKILGAHSEIYTRSEPWLMLHPLHALRGHEVITRYNSSLAQNAVHDFIENIAADGLSLYYEKLREFSLSLYGEYLKKSGKNRFLDKTPRYYVVFDELRAAFPNAKFIILYRNPLAVLSSMLDTWVHDDLSQLSNYTLDLEDGVDFLCRDFYNKKNVLAVHYERLLENPSQHIASLFEFLGLPVETDCLDYGAKNSEKWLFGDPHTVYAKSSPDSTHCELWKSTLQSPSKWSLLTEYLQYIGAERFTKLGYDYESARQTLDSARLKFAHRESSENTLNDILHPIKVSDESAQAEILLQDRQRAKLIHGRDETITILKTECDLRLEQIKLHQSLLQKRDETISELKAECANRLEQIKQHQSLVASANEKMSQLRADRDKLIEQRKKDQNLIEEQRQLLFKLSQNNQTTPSSS